jgi:glycerophosphoryl diester phosphodiesterase
MEVWGHRGSRSPGPENTAAAVRAALAAGAQGSEVDVRRSADGGLVCAHDPVVRATRRAVIDMTTSELAAAGIPPLADVVAAAAGGRLVIEVKNVPGQPDYAADAVSARLLTAALAGLVAARELSGVDLLISSFDPAALDIARDARWPTGLLTVPGVPVAEGLAYAIAAGYQELHAHVSMVTEAAPAVHAGGLRLVGWTVTTVAQAFALRELGVDAVICDDPARIAAALAAG